MTDKIPEFDADGLLPPGDYEVTLGELRSSALVVGPKNGSSVPNWDVSWREWLVDHLASGALQRELNLQDPQKVWTWDPASRKPYTGYPKAQLPMWHVYRVELYPHVAGFGCGINDEHGNELEFPAAFRRSRRDGRPRGIIKLVQERQS